MSSPVRPVVRSCSLLLAVLSLAAACSKREATRPPTIQTIRQALEGTIPAEGGTITGTTSGQGVFSATCTEGTTLAPEHVYAWTPATSGQATIFTCSPNTRFDTALYISTAQDGTGQIACN